MSKQTRKSKKRSSRINRIRHEFQEAEERCQAELRKRVGTRGTSAFEDEGFLRATVSTILAQIGDGVTRAIQKSSDNQSAEKTSIYFWPGYERIIGEVGRSLKKASPIPGYQIDPEKLGLKDFQVGFGTQGRNRNWGIDCNAFWFNVALRSPQSGDPLHDFQSGSTHLWFEYNHIPSPPDMLVVHLGDRFQCERGEGLAGYSINVQLPRNEPIGWAKKIREGIAWCLRGNENAIPWPYPIITDYETELQLAQYDVWLTACFKPDLLSSQPFLDKTIGSAVRTERFLAKWGDAEVSEYLHRNRIAQDTWRRNYAKEDNISYCVWYTIPLTEPIRSTTRLDELGSHQRFQPSLGTAMILCSRPVDNTCLGLIANWVRTMYLQIRQIEAEVLATNLASADLSGAFEHEVAKLGSALVRKFNQPLRSVLAWQDSPLALSDNATSTKCSVDDWQVITVPKIYNGLRDLFSVWGSLDFKHTGWQLNAPVPIADLFEVLQGKARAVAVSRKLIESAAPASAASAKQLCELYDVYLSAAPRFNWDRRQNLVQFHKDKDGSDQNLLYLVRLNLALMSNIAYHASRDSAVEIKWYTHSQENRRGLIVEFYNDRPGSDGESDESYERSSRYFMKTFAVAELCVRRLSGYIEPWDPPKLKHSGKFVTRYFLPNKRETSSEAAWICPISEK